MTQQLSLPIEVVISKPPPKQKGHYSAITMPKIEVIWAYLAVASKNARYLQSSDAADLCLHLTAAASLAEAHNKIWGSIFWQKASASTRRRIEETLGNLLFDIQSHLNDASDKFQDILVSAGGQDQIQKDLNEMSLRLQKGRSVSAFQETDAIAQIINSMRGATDMLTKYHYPHINQRQLTLNYEIPKN